MVSKFFSNLVQMLHKGVERPRVDIRSLPTTEGRRASTLASLEEAILTLKRDGREAYVADRLYLVLKRLNLDQLAQAVLMVIPQLEAKSNEEEH